MFVRSDKTSGPRFDCLGAFRHLSSHQYRLTKKRRLFLQPAGVRDDQERAFHQIDKRNVIERFENVDSRLIRENCLNGLPYVRIEMDRINDCYVIVLSNNAAQTSAERCERWTKVFAAMSSYKNEPLASKKGETLIQIASQCCIRIEEGGN